MKSAAPVPAILTVHQPAPGQYVIRVGDLKHRPLVVAVSKLLEDATSLIVVTPADIKVLKVSSNGASPVPVNPEPAAEPSVDVELDAETLAAIRAQEAHAVPNADQPEAEVGEVAAPVLEEPAPLVRRRKPQSGTSGRSSQCGRCRGTGEVRSFAGDKPITAKCPICQGEGTMIRYGDKR